MKKIVIRLMGGLGNQLFQYAFGKQLSIKYHMELLLDVSSYLRKGSRTYELGAYAIGDRLLNNVQVLCYNFLYYADLKMNIKSKQIIYEDITFQYDDVRVEPNNYYVGYWQNEKYFENIRQDLLRVLVFNNADIRVNQFIEKVKNTESVAVHIRRGDYLTKGYSSVYVVQDVSYYQSAREYLNAKKQNLRFYIFSDDIEWCKQKFKWDSCYFVDDTVTNDPIAQFEIMRNCKHFIIANSTYSWWAAWLGKNRNSICIAPSQWFYDEETNNRLKSALLGTYIIL